MKPDRDPSDSPPTSGQEASDSLHLRQIHGSLVEVRGLGVLILLLMFHTWPVLFGTFLAFNKYNIISPPQWVGLDNFRELLHDEQFWSGLRNSLKYILVVPVIQVLSILVALLVNRPMKGISFFRTAYYVPVVTSLPAASVSGAAISCLAAEARPANGSPA